MEVTSITVAKATLSKLIEKVLDGQKVIIAKTGKPVAKLVPIETEPSPRELGAGHWKGKIWVADDFDDTSKEIEHLFTGEAEDDGSGYARSSTCMQRSISSSVL